MRPSARLVLLLGSMVVTAAWGEPGCSLVGQAPVTVLATAGAASAGEARARLGEAASLLHEGRTARAREIVAGLVADSSLGAADRSLALSLLAVAMAAEGDVGPAARAAKEALQAMQRDTPALVRAVTGTNAALALTEAGDTRAARAALEAAAAAAAQAANPVAAATALVDLAILESRIGGDVLPVATKGRQSMASIADAGRRSELGVSLGLALLPEGHDAAASKARDAMAGEVLAQAYADAAQAKRPREMAHALGLAGELRLLRGEPKSAIAPLERAVALSRAASPADPWHYRWLWRLGASRAASGDTAGARRDLEAAVTALEASKAARAVGRFSTASLARDYRGAYLDLADLLLAAKGEGEAGRLREARDVVERSRASEVEDYFRDPCVTSSARRSADVDSLDATVAVIYPISFATRTEILVGHPTGLARFTAPVGTAAVSREVQRLRAAVERPFDERYRQPAARLHGWIVAPLEAHLAKLGVKTLVWVPDGALRGLPFAALHDGSRHLIERYAIAVTPVASLTDPRPFAATSRRAVVTGLTEARQGFAALPAVANELEVIAGLLNAPVLRDSAFTMDALRAALERAPVNMIHVASHGQFAAEAADSFVLAYDGKFSLPQLRRALASSKLREEPVELLTLSACQTAAGDERAALGLAGVALSAGARSALATLWSVNDESTASLVIDFYARLVRSGESKAQALREAQLALLRGERFSHPAFWGPFLLIGNWM